MPDRPARRPEGDLIAREMKRRHLPARQLATQIGLSEGRLRGIVNGYASAGAGQHVAVVAPATTLARIAAALDITADQLTAAGRPDAAAELADLAPADPAVAALAGVGDDAVVEVMRSPDISEADKRALVELLLDARRADDARRLDLARRLMAAWRAGRAG